MSEVARDGGGLQEERGARHGADGVIGGVLEGEVGMSRRGAQRPRRGPNGPLPRSPAGLRLRSGARPVSPGGRTLTATGAKGAVEKLG